VCGDKIKQSKGGIMVRKPFLIGVIFVFVILISGCTLAKGASGLAQGIKEGAEKDWATLKKADDWMQENFW
jgi:hypothetical protein